jgi:hypothetical protein
MTYTNNSSLFRVFVAAGTCLPSTDTETDVNDVGTIPLR